MIGIWQENEAEEAAKYGQRPGDPKALDVDENYKFDNNDKVFMGQKRPKYVFPCATTLHIKL